MPEVNTLLMKDNEWERFKTFIIAFREGRLTREQFVNLWGINQFVIGIGQDWGTK